MSGGQTSRGQMAAVKCYAPTNNVEALGTSPVMHRQIHVGRKVMKAYAHVYALHIFIVATRMLFN